MLVPLDAGSFSIVLWAVAFRLVPNKNRKNIGFKLMRIPDDTDFEGKYTIFARIKKKALCKKI